MIKKGLKLSRYIWSVIQKKRPILTVSNEMGTLKKYQTGEETHFSVVVNKKTQKSAVARNKIKRRMYTIFREQVGRVGTYTFFISKEGIAFTYEKQKKLLVELFKKTS